MILDGKTIAQKRLEELRVKILTLEKKPKLVAVIVGDDPASKMYVAMKGKWAMETGMESETVEMEKDCTDSQLITQIQRLNVDPSVTGILVQLPFPTQLLKDKQREILDSVDPLKDVDGLTSENMGLLALGHPKFLPATVRGILTLLYGVLSITYYGDTRDKYSLAGKEAVVVGRSDIDGKPLAISLIALGATVTVCNSKTINLSDHTKRADILISAVGKINLITSDMVKNGAIVIDAGTMKNIDGKWVGDVDFEKVKDKVSWITPVPGGVGPMTVVSLLENTLMAALN